MGVTVEQLMSDEVEVVEQTAVVGDLRERMLARGIHALPVVDGEGHALGIVTSSDLVEEHPAELAVTEVMSANVFTVPRYDGVHIAARVMRNHRIHHVVVTEHQRVVGIVSSFDLLRLVEEHRFEMKNPPTESVRRGNKRR